MQAVAGGAAYHEQAAAAQKKKVLAPKRGQEQNRALSHVSSHMAPLDGPSGGSSVIDLSAGGSQGR